MEKNKLKLMSVPNNKDGKIVLVLVDKNFKATAGAGKDEYLRKAVFTGAGEDVNSAIANLLSSLGMEETSSMGGGAIAGGPALNGGAFQKKKITPKNPWDKLKTNQGKR